MEEKRKGKKKSKKTFKSIGIEMGDETKVNIEERERQKKRKECSATVEEQGLMGWGEGITTVLIVEAAAEPRGLCSSSSSNFK